MKHKMYLVLGDWSDDGHGKTAKVLYECNYTVEEVQQAYKDSCKKTGIQFNHNEDYTGKGIGRSYNSAYLIATEYEDYCVSQEAMEILKPLIPMLEDWEEHDGKYYIEDSFEELWWEFVKISLPDLEYKSLTAEDTIPCINGYWNSNLNVQFAYGLYD